MDPYEVLGVSKDADEETIKKAYKTLVKKYHPDRYINNPLADLAAEKMSQINKAYDMIINKKTEPQSAGGGYGAGTGGYSQYTNIKPTFAMVRQLLNMNRPSQALMLLQQLPRTAEWYYLCGLAYVRQGFYSKGIQAMEQAVRMEPGNAEYSDMLNSIKNNANSYNTGGGMYNMDNSSCPLPCWCWCIPCCPCDGSICC